MKTIIRFFALGFLLFPLCALAQKATEQRQYEIRVEWEDMQDYPERVPYKVPIYYDDDDNVVKHGPFKINYKSDLSAQVGQKCIITYVVSGNYVNGKLNGAFSVEQAAIIAQGTLRTKGALNFVNGVPTGTWTFSESITAGGQSESATCSITIKDNQLVSYNDGENNFKINNDGTFSGKLDGDVYKNSVNTSEFIRKTGEKTKLDENAKSLINAFIAGTTSESELIGKGFGFVRKNWIGNFDFKNLDYYISKLEINHFMDKKAVSVSVFDLKHSTSTNSNISPACTLMRVNVISAEELIPMASTIKNANNVSEDSVHIYWKDADNIWYRYYYNANLIENSDGTYFFTDDAKMKFEEAIKVGLEERRLELERIAEEKRLQEIEKQRMRIQSICDYLVSEKTALSISYDDNVGRYFDPTGLNEEYWRLDLEKAIKPFCKIAGCKLISYDDSGAAVFEITKFHKKGNITYRVPVTIVNNKILVTSINFSNATIVE